MSDSVEARVARGAAWLDEKVPGWERRIDLGVLDIGSCRVCMVGQLSPPWHLADAGLNLWSAGFASVSWPWEDNPEVDALNDAWRSLIKERFDTGNLSG